MKKFELNKTYTIKYKWYEDREEDCKGLCIEVFTDEYKFKTTEASSYWWFKKIKTTEVLEYSEINIIDFTEELMWNIEAQVNRDKESLDESEKNMLKVKKFIENRTFLWNIKNLIWCSINSWNNW